MDKINSVLSIRVTKAIYRADRPYLFAGDKETSGSGFIIDIEKGLVVTNAHVVANAISISGRSSVTGRKDLSLELLGICREKDVAICKISSSDIPLITSGLSSEQLSKLNLNFGDSMNINPGDVVISLGYPLDSENIKMTTGVISGIVSSAEIQNENSLTNLNEVEDSYRRSPCYIQISAAINHGSSGGPLLILKNNEYVVIGITAGGYSKAQNVGYAIPSRTFLAIYDELINNLVVKMPTLGLEWCKTNREIMKKQTGSSSTYGIYVRKVYPDSCFDLLKKGDIIRRIDYVDIFWDKKIDISYLDEALNIALENKKKREDEIIELRKQIADLISSTSSTSPSSTVKNNKNISVLNEKIYSHYREMNIVTVFLDRYGMSNKIGKLKNPDEVDETKIEFEKTFIDRKMDLSEIIDMVPIGTEINLNISRDLNWYMLKSKYVFVENDRISHVYPRITPYDYEIFAGICVMNLDEAHFPLFDNLKCNEKYKKEVIIVQVFPDTSASRTQVLKPGHLIKSIIGYTNNFELIPDTHCVIHSLEDVRHVLNFKPEQIQITTTDDSTFVISLATIIKEDKNTLSSYKINHKYLLE
jgi:S1-C subfamily serine protease